MERGEVLGKKEIRGSRKCGLKKKKKKERKENYKNKPKTVKKMAVGKLILILILKVNG